MKGKNDVKKIIYVDVRSRKWDKKRLDDLFNALYEEADAEQVKKYFIKGKFSF
jgi:hypothetical protein